MRNIRFHEIKEKMQETITNGFEPELTIRMNDKEYMIIGYKNRFSFQRCSSQKSMGGGEVFCSTIDELYTTESVDNILLKRDWDDIKEFECFDFELYYAQDLQNFEE